MAESSIAKAYVQVLPTTKGIKNSLSGIFGSEGSSAGSVFGGNMVSMIRNTVAAAGLGTLIKEALSEGADKQQSLGGIEMLFKDSADTVITAAENAYKTAGMSANDYMETVTSFSASLLQGLSGDTQAAAEVADMALTDMADNANKMGTSMELIENAYQGFAKQNYTMLDNLKLGYGGTKTEMERLLADAQKLTGVKYDIGNLADVYEAIHVIQEEMHISGLTAEEAAEMVAAGLMTEEEAFEALGTTAKEASTTFSGSLASMKAAASNVMASLTLGEDIGPSLTALSDAVFTFIGGNLLPMVGNLMSGLPDVISQGISVAIQGMNIASNNADEILAQGIDFIIELGGAIIQGAPYLAEAGLNLALSVGQALLEYDWQATANDVLTALQGSIDLMAAEIFGTDGSIIEAVASGVTENLPELLSEGVSIVTEVAAGLVSNLPEAVEATGDLMDVILDFIMSSLPELLLAGADIVTNLVIGIGDCLPDVALAAVDICAEFLGTVAENLPEFLSMGFELIGELIAGIIEATPDILQTVLTLIGDIGYEFFSYDWGELGLDIVQGIADGIVGGVGAIISAAWSAAESALSAAKEALSIHSPSRRFRDEVGAQIPPGIALGVEENADVVKASMSELSDYASDSFNADFTLANTSMEFTRSVDFAGSGQSDSGVLEALLDLIDSNDQRALRIIVLLEQLLEALLSIEFGDETIAKSGQRYLDKIAIVKGV